MTVFKNFRKAVLEEALPEYCEKLEFDNQNDALESFLYDFVNTGTDDLFNTYDLRDQLVAVAFPDVDWKNTELPKPVYKSPAMEATDEAVNDFYDMMGNMFKPFKEISHE